MAYNACEACTDIREIDPALITRGFSDTECASLKNDTGLVSSSGNDNCTDLNNLADCLIGNMEQEVDEYDVCDWRDFSKLTLANLWTVAKGIICSNCGAWTNIHNLWTSLGDNVERIDQSIADTNNALDDAVDNLNDSLDDAVDNINTEITRVDTKCPYLVGDLYITTNSTNPSTLWDGTQWQQIKDVQLIAAGDTYVAGNTYGSATHSHTTGDHVLTLAEVPSHSHTPSNANDKFLTSEFDIKVNDTKRGYTSTDSSGNCWVYAESTSAKIHQYANTSAAGGNGAHNHGATSAANNLFTSLAVNVWKRIA